MNRRLGALLGLLGVITGVLWWVLSRPVLVESATSEDAGASEPAVGSTPQRVTQNTSDAGAARVQLTEVATPANEFARFSWGSGEGQLGKSAPDEANPEAPMSLTVDAAGNVWVLDQVNDRLVKMDRTGKVVQTVKLSVQGAQDVAVTADGKVLVLDRLVDRSVAVLGPDGTPVGELPIVGKGLEEPGGVTGVFTQGDSVYVEREHGDAVRVGDTSGHNDVDRPEVPGRPAQDGRTYLTANIVNSSAGQVMVTAIEAPSQQHRFSRQLVLGQPVLALNALDTDQSGVIYLGTVMEAPDSTPEATKLNITLLCLDPLDGRLVGQASWAANGGAEETFRELTVLPGGGVLFLQRTEQGPRVLRYGCGS